MYSCTSSSASQMSKSSNTLVRDSAAYKSRIFIDSSVKYRRTIFGIHVVIEKHFLWLFAITFLFVMPALCHNLKHSPYRVIDRIFRGSSIHETLKQENDVRLAQAMQYFRNLSPEDSLVRRLKSKSVIEKPDIIFTIVAMSRNRLGKSIDEYKPRYLTQALWKWLIIMKEAERSSFPYSFHMTVCNVDHDPDSFIESKELEKFVPTIYRFNHSTTDDIPRLEKERQDYIFCLNQSLSTGAKYVFLLEDDALPRDETFHILNYTLKNRIERKLLRGEYYPNEDNIAWIKFFHPEWEGFLRLYPDRIPEMVAIGAIFGTLMTLIYEKVATVKSSSNVYRIWSIFIIYSILIAHLVGRENLVQFRRLFLPYLFSIVPSCGCCTQAILYTQDGGRSVMDYLNKTQDGLPKDLSTYRFLSQSGLAAYYVQPNTFDHIGLYSLVKSKVDITRV